MVVRVLITDDHPVVRTGLRAFPRSEDRIAFRECGPSGQGEQYVLP